jgi:hypothetical protein
VLRRRTSGPAKTVDMDLVANALAKAVADGDIVNFRTLFESYSPAREESTETFSGAKYQYLLPDEEEQQTPAFANALREVRSPLIWQHIEQELKAKRRAQLPWQLVLMLGDNAVRRRKLPSAAQAYELLRIRPRMQALFFRQGDAWLDQGSLKGAVEGYVIGTGLDYDYAAFPEPLPRVLDFQKQALILHGEYPETPEDCIGLQEPEPFVRTALSYLLNSAEAAARLENRPIELRIAFLQELVYVRDPSWSTFVERYHRARETMARFAKRLEQARGAPSLAEEIERELGEDPGHIPAELLGRAIENGEWWQYLQELAYEHPAAALFVARQAIGEREIIIPRCRADSPAAQALQLAHEASV